MDANTIIPYATLAVCLAAAWMITFKALQNWRGDKYLCDTCIFNNDESCHKTERPRALKCTVYRSSSVDEYKM